MWIPRQIASYLFSDSVFCFLFWNIHLMSENKVENFLKKKTTTQDTVSAHSKLWNVVMCFLCREEITLGCQVEGVRSPKTSSCSRRMSKSSRSRRSSRSRSRSRSSGSLKYSGRYSRSLSLSSCRWVNHFCTSRIATNIRVTVSTFPLAYIPICSV